MRFVCHSCWHLYPSNPLGLQILFKLELPLLPQSPFQDQYAKPSNSLEVSGKSLGDETSVGKGIELTPLTMGGRYQTSHTIAQLVIIMRRYRTIEYLLLFQKGSPKLELYCTR